MFYLLRTGMTWKIIITRRRMIDLNIVNRGNGYETRQSSLLYVVVLFFGLDPAQNTIVVYSVLRN